MKFLHGCQSLMVLLEVAISLFWNTCLVLKLQGLCPLNLLGAFQYRMDPSCIGNALRDAHDYVQTCLHFSQFHQNVVFPKFQGKTLIILGSIWSNSSI